MFQKNEILWDNENVSILKLPIPNVLFIVSAPLRSGSPVSKKDDCVRIMLLILKVFIP